LHNIYADYFFQQIMLGKKAQTAQTKDNHGNKIRIVSQQPGKINSHYRFNPPLPEDK
jgi:hypothetical protein